MPIWQVVADLAALGAATARALGFRRVSEGVADRETEHHPFETVAQIGVSDC